MNADGIQRVKRALFAAAYGDDEIVAKMAESTDDTRNVSNGLMAAAPMMARLSVKKNVPYMRELRDAITDAVKQLDTLRASGDGVIHGFHSDGVTFLNVESEITPQWTFWHEARHWMKANNPNLYNDIVHEISGAEGFTKEQLDAYRKEIGAEHMSDADVIEEMIADDGARITLRDEKALSAVTYSQTDKSMKWIEV